MTNHLIFTVQNISRMRPFTVGKINISAGNIPLKVDMPEQDIII